MEKLPVGAAPQRVDDEHDRYSSSMARFRRVSMLVAVATATAAVTAMVAVMASTGVGAAPTNGVEHVLPAGVNFGIHTYSDTNFCLESEGDSRIIVSQCAARDNQHFTFTHNTDNTNVIVDGYGLCLDRGNGKVGTAITSKPCTFGATQRFKYTSTGRLQQPSGTSCVAAAVAAQDAAVYDTNCAGTKGGLKIFQLSH